MPPTIKKKEGFEGQKAIIIPRPLLLTQCEKNAIINKLYITDIGYYPKARFHYRMRPNGSDQHILIYCQEGTGKVTIGSQAFDLEAGDYCIIPQNTKHTYAASEDAPWTIYWIHFKGSTSTDLVEFARKKTGMKGFIRSAEKPIALFHDIYHQLERGYSITSLININLCFGYLLTTFINNDTLDTAVYPDTKDAIDIAIDYMGKHLEQSLTLQEIAAATHLSPGHFSTIFKKKTGFGVIEYFNHLKMQRACQYLLFTELRVKEISEQLGIEDQHYFSRLFTKVMGISPNEYRKKRQH